MIPTYFPFAEDPAAAAGESYGEWPLLGHVASVRARGAQARQIRAVQVLSWNTWPTDTDGPLGPQPDTYQPPIAGLTALTRAQLRFAARARLAHRLVLWDNGEVTVAPEPDTYVQAPIAGTASLRATTGRFRQRAARSWSYGDFADGPIAAQPHTEQPPLAGTAALRRGSRERWRLAAVPALHETPHSVVPPEADTWTPDQVPGTMALGRSLRAFWRRSLGRPSPHGEFLDGPLGAQPDTYQPPTAGTSALRRLGASIWRAASRPFLRWGDWDGQATTEAAPDVIVFALQDVQTITARADVTAVVAHPDPSETDPL